MSNSTSACVCVSLQCQRLSLELMLRCSVQDVTSSIDMSLRLAAEAYIGRVSRHFALGSRSSAGGSGRWYFCELKTEQPQPSRLAREAVPGADKGSRDAGGGVDACWNKTRAA